MFAEDKESVQFLKDETVKTKLANAKKLSEVSADAYDAIFYVGGHGPVIDLPTDEASIKLAASVSSTTAHPNFSHSHLVLQRWQGHCRRLPRHCVCFQYTSIAD